MTQLIAHTDLGPGIQPLTPFRLGVGVQLDTAVDSVRPDASALANLHEIGVERYRVNVRWDAVMRGPEQLVDHAVLDGLAKTIEQILDAGLSPLVALDNASLPQNLEADGGWRNAATACAYGNFVGAVGARLGDLVDDWIVFAAPRPHHFDASMTNNLVTAHGDAVRILRAHAPQAVLGTSVDIAQVVNRSGWADSAAAHAWIAHLGSVTATIGFVALNVDQPSIHSPRIIADALRLLDVRVPGRSFLLTETHAGGGSDSRSSRLVDIEAPERFAVVDALFAQIQELRSERININGTFGWPFSGTSAAREALTPSSVEVYRRVLTADLA